MTSFFPGARAARRSPLGLPGLHVLPGRLVGLVLTALSLGAPAAAAEEQAELPPTSVYHLDATWQSPDGRTQKLSSLKGSVVVVAMIYSTCQHTCPRIIADMRRLRGSLGPRAGDVRFVLVSLDPAKDTVARLRTFAKDTGLDEQGFLLLRGDDDAVRDLAAVLDVRYQPMGKTDIAHANVLTILDESGVILRQERGTGESLDQASAAILDRLRRARR